MTLEEIRDSANSKEQRISELDGLARECEQKSRDYRAERATMKIELAELRQQVHNLAAQAAAVHTMKAATAAKAETEAAAKSIALLKAELESKLKELNTI